MYLCTIFKRRVLIFMQFFGFGFILFLLISVVLSRRKMLDCNSIVAL